MGLISSLLGWLDSGPDRQKGESFGDFKARRHGFYRESWAENKKASDGILV